MKVLNQDLHAAWKGYLSFTLEDRFGKTVVKDKKHFGPLVLQRPYYQEVDRPTILVIHPPGGLVSGDELITNITLKSKSKAFISTPAATKFYRSIGDCTLQSQQINLAEHTQLEWLPQETLFFNKCRVHNLLQFNLNSPMTSLIAWDIVGLGRPAMNEVFDSGELKQRIEINIGGSPIFIDQFYFKDSVEMLRSPFGMDASTLMATMLFYHHDKAVLTQLQKLFLSQDWISLCGISMVNNVLVMRTLDSDLDNLKQRLISAWQLARPLVIDAEPVMPRIWRT